MPNPLIDKLCKKCGSQKRQRPNGDTYCLECEKENKRARNKTDEYRAWHREWEKKNKHPLHSTYYDMLDRCRNPKNPKYHRYGGRKEGPPIEVCDRWLGPNGKKNFIKDMGPRPEGYTLERKNNDGPYAPWNCIWAPDEVQSRNKSTSFFVEYNGQIMNMVDLSNLVGISGPTLKYRWLKGLRGEELVRKPAPRERYTLNGKEYSLTELAKVTGKNASVLKARISNHGWSVEEAATIPLGQARDPHYRSKPRKIKMILSDATINYLGDKISLACFSKITGIPVEIVIRRARKLKDADWIVSTNSSRRHSYKNIFYTLTELSVISKISIGTLFLRICKLGWSVEKAVETDTGG